MHVSNRMAIGMCLALGLGSMGCAPEEDGTPGVTGRRRATPTPTAPLATSAPADTFNASIRHEATPTPPPTPRPLPTWTAPTAPPLPSVIFVSPAPQTTESPGTDTNAGPNDPITE